MSPGNMSIHRYNVFCILSSHGRLKFPTKMQSLLPFPPLWLVLRHFPRAVPLSFQSCYKIKRLTRSTQTDRAAHCPSHPNPSGHRVPLGRFFTLPVCLLSLRSSLGAVPFLSALISQYFIRCFCVLPPLFPPKRGS